MVSSKYQGVIRITFNFDVFNRVYEFSALFLPHVCESGLVLISVLKSAFSNFKMPFTLNHTSRNSRAIEVKRELWDSKLSALSY